MKYWTLAFVTVAVACGRQDLDAGNSGTAGVGVRDEQDAGAGSDGNGSDAGMPVDGQHVPEPAVDGGTRDVGSAAEAGPAPYQALFVAAGSAHTCALLDNHSVKCWGDNSYGALGTGDPRSRGVILGDMGNDLPPVNLGTGRTAKAISAGRYATCAILDDDTVKCWGWINQAFGIEHAVTGANNALGVDASQMGDALPRIDLAGHTARLLAVGYAHTCVVREDESIRCWGQTPVQDFPPRVGHKITGLFGSNGVIALYDDGSTAAFPDAQGNLQRPTDAGANVRAVAVAGSRTTNCVLWDDGLVTGIGAWPPDDARALATPVLGEMGWPCGIYKDGSATCPYAAGKPSWLGVDLGHGPTIRVGQSIVSMAGGLFHFCAALSDGEVKCWSTEDQPALGMGGAYPSATAWPSVDLGTR